MTVKPTKVASGGMREAKMKLRQAESLVLFAKKSINF